MLGQIVTEIENYSQTISEWISKYYADGFFLLLGLIAFVYLYISCKELRVKWLLPIGIIFFVILNPILYRLIFSRIVYWRLLWMLPMVMLIASAFTVLLKRQTKAWSKYGILFVFAIMIMFKGEYMFSETVFSQRSNWEKISQETIEVCDIMLANDITPSAVVHSDIFTEVRQYSGDIRMMYGREVVGMNFIRSVHQPEYSVYWEFNERNFEYVLGVACELGYNFVVVKNVDLIDEEVLKQFEFCEIGRTLDHVIYYNKNI